MAGRELGNARPAQRQNLRASLPAEACNLWTQELHANWRRMTGIRKQRESATPPLLAGAERVLHGQECPRRRRTTANQVAP